MKKPSLPINPVKKRRSRTKVTGTGSFWLNDSVIEYFIKNKTKAEYVASYLILARHTDNTGIFTSATTTALKNKLLFNDSRTEHVIESLRSMDDKRLLLNCDEYVKLVSPINKSILYNIDNEKNKLFDDAGELYESLKRKKNYKFFKLMTGLRKLSQKRDLLLFPMPKISRGVISKSKWALNLYDNDSFTWFPCGLVDGDYIEGKSIYSRPLKRFCDGSQHLALRMLLYFYQKNDNPNSGGIPSYLACYPYDMELLGTHDGYDFWRGKKSELHVSETLVRSMFPQETDNRKFPEMLADTRNAIQYLEEHGFIYRSVCVLDNPGTNSQSAPRYELGVKSDNIRWRPKDRYQSAQRIEKMARNHGYETAREKRDAVYHFYDRYPAIAPRGAIVHIAEIFKLRFAITNPRNAKVKENVSKRWRNYNDLKEWLGDLGDTEILIDMAIDEPCM